MTVSIVKKTRRDWNCSSCSIIIEMGSMMVRQYFNRWHQSQYCLECGSPKIKDALKSAIESFKVFEKHKSDDPNSAYMMFKNGKEYYQNALKLINENNRLMINKIVEERK